MTTTTTGDPTVQTEPMDGAGGRIADEVTGRGPSVVLSPGMGDTRRPYRILAPLLANAGYRVASVDLRGHGGSSTGWSPYSRADTAGDLVAVVRTLGGPAVIVGQSFSGGSATIALVIMGREDPDFADPEAEAAAIVGLLPAGLGRYAMIEGAGHCPHAQCPQQVADAILPFLAGLGEG